MPRSCPVWFPAGSLSRRGCLGTCRRDGGIRCRRGGVRRRGRSGSGSGRLPFVPLLNLGSTSILVVVFFLFVVVIVDDVRAEDCPTFQCYHNSTCEDSDADFSDHPRDAEGKPLDMHTELQRNGHHCACQPGWTGLRCARQYESCSSNSNHKCYHGGRCIEGLKDAYGNEQMFCDCSEAVDEFDPDIRYVGKYCELKQTIACNDDKSVFCVNGGTCQPHYQNRPNKPCKCPDGYEGKHCEFKSGSVPKCTLECENDGVCRLGLKKYVDAQDFYLSDFFKDHSKFMYCDCKEDYYGVRCEKSTSRCGERHCFNGGQCVQRRKDGITEAHCDCTKAHDEESSYAGRYCQYQADDFCDKSDTGNGQLFCVNGGRCNPKGSHLDCICPKGYHGPVCEFLNSEDDAEDGTSKEEKCNLICKNGGQCRVGFKDTRFFGKYGADLEKYNISHLNFQHCVCPQGYVGIECEHEVTICGQGEHVCFYGAKCLENQPGGDPSGMKCDCTAGYTSSKQLAGRYCQHKSTTICQTGGVEPGTGSDFSFCVNDGKCKKILEDGSGDGHMGCECSNGFEGLHCEYLQASSDQIIRPTMQGETDVVMGSEILGILAGLAVVMALILLAAVRISRRYRSLAATGASIEMANASRGDSRHSSSSSSSSSPSVASSPSAVARASMRMMKNQNIAPAANSHRHTVGPPVLDMGPAKDLDGNELENVEII